MVGPVSQYTGRAESEEGFVYIQGINLDEKRPTERLHTLVQAK